MKETLRAILAIACAIAVMTGVNAIEWSHEMNADPCWTLINCEESVR